MSEEKNRLKALTGFTNQVFPPSPDEYFALIVGILCTMDARIAALEEQASAASSASAIRS